MEDVGGRSITDYQDKDEKMKKCSCGKCDWHWELGDDLKSWIKCAGCGDSLFEKGIGVILINWDFTDIGEINIEDVLYSNKYNNGVVVKNEN